MPDPRDHQGAAPEPPEPTPPGVTPNKPKDPDVYGTQWGDVGGQKPKKPPTDRPDRIGTPGNDDAPPPSRTAPPGVS